MAGVTDCVPDSALLPVHASLAVHDAAPDDDQFRVEEAPTRKVVGDAVRVSVGGGGGVTDTLTVLETDPPGPLHVIE